MKAREEQPFSQSRRVESWMYILVLLMNVVFFICIAAVYQRSAKAYNERLFDENISTVDSLNAASANAAYTYTQSMSMKIEDTVAYIQANALNFDEAVRFLGESNTSPDRQFQLVQSGVYGSTGELSFGDYSGVSVRKKINADGKLETLRQDIVYGSGYYDILKCFTDVHDENDHGMCFTPEFTNPATKLKCFGVYRHVDLIDAGGQRKLYTVLLAVNSQAALSAYNMQNKYDAQSTVLINENGDYIIKGSDYRNANFYDYIANYNDLTLDKKAGMQQAVRAAAESGVPTSDLFYKNHRGADCVFSVTVMNGGWYSVTCVPLSSFNLSAEDADYTLIILVLFAVLFILDGFAIFYIYKVMNYNVMVAQRAQEEANQANKAKSRFLSTMSHELRTPLNAIIGFTALSSDSIDDKPMLKDYLKKIDISSKLLLQLISDILDVSAIESDKIKLNSSAFDITRLVTSLSAIYYAQCANKGIEFGVVLKDIHAETLIGDSVRVNQVLLNFLSNAVKFTPGGGKVTLRIEQIKRESDAVTLRFSVSDTGCGISDEMHGRLFKPFERAAGNAARKYSGTGLGLSIAKNLTELMGGKIGVESKEGEGSRFFAEIPFKLPAETPRRSFSPIKDMHVLAAISNPDEREYISRILDGFGLPHSMAATAAETQALLRAQRDAGRPFDLCMLDWKLSDLTAIDAARSIRTEFDHDALKLVVLAYDLAEAKPACLLSGADFVCGKPVFPSALYNFLEEIVTGRARVIPDTAQSYDLRGKRVLLVEDNKMNLEIAVLLLAKTGLEVETAENGQLGCERFLDSPKGYFDAILMDVQMPVMDGYQATRSIRASAHPQAKTIPIIAMTADAFSEDVDKARDAGMNEHIPKPIVLDTLYATLKRYIG